MTGKILYSITAIASFFTFIFVVMFMLEVNKNAQINLPACQPYNVEVMELSKNSATIIWKTKAECSGRIKYGETSDDMEYVALQEENKSKDHIVVVSGLFPNTQYSYIILSESELYANQGLPLEFETAAL